MMSSDPQPHSEIRSLESIFKAHFENSETCRQVLHDLFSNLEDPIPYITRIKQLEEEGDRLTGEAYETLESHEYSRLTRFIKDLIHVLDDIVDGFNKTARLIDIFQSEHIEAAANEILSEQQAMSKRFQKEINMYPDNDFESLRSCRNALKQKEENVDLIYHEWRKKNAVCWRKLSGTGSGALSSTVHIKQ